jgi:hypothetical protein
VVGSPVVGAARSLVVLGRTAGLVIGRSPVVVVGRSPVVWFGRSLAAEVAGSPAAIGTVVGVARRLAVIARRR